MGEATVKKLRGRAAFYRPKLKYGQSILLTKIGKRILVDVSKRTKKSKADVVEHLLREYGSTLEFPSAK